MQLIHFDCVNGFLNSIKEIIWQTEATYCCPLILSQFHTSLTWNTDESCITIETHSSLWTWITGTWVWCLHCRTIQK